MCMYIDGSSQDKNEQIVSSYYWFLYVLQNVYRELMGKTVKWSVSLPLQFALTTRMVEMCRKLFGEPRTPVCMTQLSLWCYTNILDTHRFVVSL